MAKESETYHVDISEEELNRILNEVDDSFHDRIGELDDDDLEHLK